MESNTLFLCDICDKICQSKLNLVEHRNAHLGKKPYQCKFCGKRFAWLSNWTQHEIRHTSAKLYTCVGCNKKWVCDKKKARHLCGVCGKSYISRSRLEQHEIKSHSNSHGNKGNSEKPCQLIAHGRTGLQLHESVPRIAPSVPCMICGLIFNNPLNLERHIIKAHANDCAKCFQKFTRLADMKRHYDTVHLKKTIFQCNFCNGCFSTKDDLENHKGKHTGERPVVCSKSPKSYGHMRSLGVHESIHHGRKTHTTLDCDQVYNNPVDKEEHILSRIECDQCAETFSTRKELEKHAVTHTEYYRFSTEFCSKIAAYRNSIMEHPTTEHIQDSHQIFSNPPDLGEQIGFYKECGQCAETFSTTAELEKHAVTHTAYYQLACDFYNKISAYRNKRMENTEFLTSLEASDNSVISSKRV